MTRLNLLATIAVSALFSSAALANTTGVPPSGSTAATGIAMNGTAPGHSFVSGKSAGGVTSIGTGKFGVTTGLAGTASGDTYLSSTPNNTPINSPAS